MEITKVGVLGCGLMGHGITQICAEGGWEVVVRELSQEKLDAGLAKIDKQLARAVEKGKVEQADADAVRARINPTLDYSDLGDCDLVVDAILGTGFRGTLTGFLETVVADLNSLGVPIVAIDLPTGVSADSVTVDGQPYSDFDAYGLTVRLPKTDQRVKIKVTIASNVVPE